MENDAAEVTRIRQKLLAMKETDPERYHAFMERMLNEIEIDSMQQCLAGVTKRLRALRESIGTIPDLTQHSDTEAEAKEATA